MKQIYLLYFSILFIFLQVHHLRVTIINFDLNNLFEIVMNKKLKFKYI